MTLQHYKKFLAIALPATIESLFVVLITLLDTWMVAPLGTGAIAAVAVASQPKLLIFLVFMALGTATTIVVSQAYGRESRQGANTVLAFAVVVALVGSLVLGALAAAFAWPIMLVCSGQADTMEMSVIFLRILMIGMVFQALSTAMNAALRGVGNMMATLASSVAMGVTDIIFNYLLIEGHLGFPAWGVAGAATATTLGNVVGFLVSLSFLLRKDGFLDLRYCLANKVRLRSEETEEVCRQLANVFAENILMRIGFLISGIIVARLGSYETSIYSVGMLLLNISFAFGDGIQAAVLVQVGKSVGAKDRELCLTQVRVGMQMAVIVAALVTVTCAMFGGSFFTLYSDDPDFIAAGAVVSLFAAAVVPFQIIRIARISVLRGLGDSKRPRQIATISVLLVDPPCSLLFAIALGLGQVGLWIGTLICQVVWFLLAEVISRKELANYWKSQSSQEGASS